MEINYDKTKLAAIAKKYHLKFVILHGSYASGFPDKESDLDIAALAEKPLDFKTELSAYGELEDAFELPPSKELDFRTLNRVDPFFHYEVVKTGRLLYGNEIAYEEYKAFAERAYFEDAKPLLELEKQLAYKFQRYLNTAYVK
ncbi:MAG: nucleotidyltransferase domain-containing protein [Candidatus Doudnabacteria bacterium]|nr:nucleotidyltransferase domain-containing protein [Candidatus Doudnabacteria bacterium]